MSTYYFFSSSGISVKDLGRFTRGGVSPFWTLIGLDAVFALARQHWIYEKFSEYRVRLDSVLIVRLRSRYNSRIIMRLTWDNRGSPSRSQAQVLNEKEWRGSRYRRKSKELVGLTDVRLLSDGKPKPSSSFSLTRALRVVCESSTAFPVRCCRLFSPSFAYLWMISRFPQAAVCSETLKITKFPTHCLASLRQHGYI